MTPAEVIPFRTGPRCYSYIRFSTPEQLKGDSLRRQLRASEEYAREHGLELDETLTLRDLGLSAFKGDHRTRGTLGEFLRLVEGRKVPKGSTLIVESLDRLSREQVLDALNQFTSIIGAGIKVVTLSDRMEYDRDSINANFGQLLMSLVIMSRAHEESATKAKRLSEAWKAKRQRIGERKLTARAPAWLNLSSDKTSFEVIPERGEILRRIYQMKLEGRGAEWIAKELNQSRSKWVPKSGWRKSYVIKILTTRAVIGEYQPCVKVNGKRQPTGEPIPDYFPAMVPEDVFYRVQEVFRSHVNRGGQNGPVSNLFSHLARCGYCDGPMVFVNKGKPPKGGHYLVCDNARRGRGCAYHSVPYREFEELVLTYCKNLDAAELLDEEDKRKTELALLEGGLAAAKAKIEALGKKIKNVTESIADEEDRETRRLLQGKLKNTLEEKAALEAEAEEIRGKIRAHRRSKGDLKAQLDSIAEVLERLKTKDPEWRARLKNQLRRLIERIDVFPVGGMLLTPEKIEEGIKAVQEVRPEITAEELEDFRKETEERAGNKNLRMYRVVFKGGSRRYIQPISAQQLVMDIDREKGTSWMLLRDGVTKDITYL